MQPDQIQHILILLTKKCQFMGQNVAVCNIITFLFLTYFVFYFYPFLFTDSTISTPDSEDSLHSSVPPERYS